MNVLWGWKKFLLLRRDNDHYRRELVSLDKDVTRWNDTFAPSFYAYQMTAEQGYEAARRLSNIESRLDSIIFNAPSAKGR